MKIVIAEKPSVARDIARVLGATEHSKTHIAGPEWTVTWAFGHLLEIAQPEAMNPAWAGPWRRETLPMLPAAWSYAPRADAAAHLKAVSELLRGARLVVAATDAGREGEHIFRLIYQHSRSKAPVKRLWISSLTEEAIRAGFEALKPSSEFDALADAAATRAHADWLVGLNTTRAYTLLNGDMCTVGRVQTPTLALLVGRQREIEAFKPTPFAEIELTLEALGAPPFSARVLNTDNKPRFDDLGLARGIAASLAQVSTATVKQVETKEIRTAPPPLFNLLALQKEANKRWGYTAAAVLEIAQALYEAKHLTYPRTDSRHLSTDMVGELPHTIHALAPLYGAAAVTDRAPQDLGKAYVDNTKLTDHHAIIPTPKPPTAPLADERQRNVYDLVARRFLAIFLDPRLTSETVALFTAGAHTARARGVVMKDPGWTVLDPPTRDADATVEDDQVLPPLAVGQTVSKRSQKVLEKKTSPPKPHNDATLLDAMRLAGKLVEDEALAEHMKDSGLGTPATRAAIIERLISSEYVERKKKALVPTAKGCALIDQVHPNLRDPELTAQWEERLARIEAGDGSAAAFERGICEWLQQLIPQVLASAPIATPATTGLGTCPLCKEGAVRPTPKGWGCSRYKDGCSFGIWKDHSGKKLTDQQVTELLSFGRTLKVIKGFASKNKPGTKFDARLVLELADGKARVGFAFDK